MNNKYINTPFNFILKTFLQNKQIFFLGLVASLIFSILFFHFQKKDLQIIKYLVQASNMSKVSALLRKTNQNPVSILEEYVYILKRGIPKSEFFELIKKNRDITDDELEKLYVDFLEFKNEIQLDKMRLYRKNPMYVLNYNLQIKYDDQKTVSDAITQANNYLVENLNILNEIVKNRVINYYMFNFELNKSDKINNNKSEIDVYEFKVDGTEAFLVTKNVYKISEKNLNELTAYFKFNESPLIDGIDAYKFKIIKKQFSKIITLSFSIFIIIFYLICFLKLKKK
tara:strand:- start:4262 stop:5113 length:852 start_codon:yes stop_codon:yes gene_type:complete